MKSATDIRSTLKSHQAPLRKLGVQSLYLFGSRARGDHRPDSDVDLFYQTSNPRLEFSISRVIDIQLYLAELFPLKVDAFPAQLLKKNVLTDARHHAVRIF